MKRTCVSLIYGPDKTQILSLYNVILLVIFALMLSSLQAVRWFNTHKSAQNIFTDGLTTKTFYWGTDFRLFHKACCMCVHMCVSEVCTGLGNPIMTE